MLKSRKHVFWEALFLTVVVFFFGMLIGVSFENSQQQRINEYYMKSEISLVDILAMNSISEIKNIDCEFLIESNLNFADRIYSEAVLLEKYDNAKKITDSIELAHKKYDLFRVFLWIDSIRILEKCGRSFSSVVYLYNTNPDDLELKATQGVWSRILFDLKQEKNNEVVLIPIGVDGSLESVNLMVKRFEIKQLPAVVINNEYVITELSSVKELEEYFD
ncbi:MAG: hypothetical protein ABFQ65_04285 [Nanoarchaeota archaeon]